MSKEQFRALPPGKKILYILRYRTWDLILGVIMLVLLGTWIYKDYIREQPFLNIEMINACAESPDGESLDPFLMANGYHPQENKVEISKVLQVTDPDQNRRCNPKNLLICNIAVGETDVYFWNTEGDSEEMDHALKTMALMDLREVLPPEVLQTHEDDLIFTAPVLSGGYPCGIVLEDNEWILENHYYSDCIVGVARTAADLNLVRDFLMYIL